MFRTLLFVVLLLCYTAPLRAQEGREADEYRYLRECTGPELIHFDASPSPDPFDMIMDSGDAVRALYQMDRERVEFPQKRREFHDALYLSYHYMLRRVPPCREWVELYITWHDWMTRMEIGLYGIRVEIDQTYQRYNNALDDFIQRLSGRIPRST